MFDRLGAATYRYRRWFLAGTGAFVVFAVVWGTGVFGALSDAGFDDPDSESSRGAVAAERTLGRGNDLFALVSSPRLTVEDPRFEAAVDEVVGALPHGDGTRAVSYYDTGSAAFVAKDRRSTYIAVRLPRTDGSVEATYTRLMEDFRAPAGFQVRFGGNVPMNHDINSQVSADIMQAEMLSFPILLVLLLFVFRGLVAASLPLAVGGVAILGAFTVLNVLTRVMDVSVFAINIVTMLGLGLAIDYALFVVSRFREELGNGYDVPAALTHTMRTAGRTVAVSGLTVTLALSSLLLFPQVFYRSMGLGGMAAVAVAMVTSLTALPALLAVLGHRVDALSVPRLLRMAGTKQQAHGGAWFRIAGSVMRRPVVYVAVIVPVLLLLGSPFLHVQFGGIDHRALPEGTESREVAETLLRDFPRSGDPVRVALQDTSPDATRIYTDGLRSLPGVAGVQVIGSRADDAVIDVTYDHDVYSTQTKALVRQIRDLPAPGSATVLVTGTTAFLVDALDSLAAKFPWMAAWALGATFVLLFLAFGSVLLPVKAIAMNLLSLSASFGAVVWVFQEGHLSDLLGFTSTGTVEATQPILMLAITFGLSMDYEVFLLSRVREQWDLTGDNRLAVATGLQRTGRLITSAALLLVVVIGAFSTSGVTFIKMIGIGMAIAIVVDATVVRALLVPATMRLLGAANWWLPRPLERLWRRFGIREGEAPAPQLAGQAEGYPRMADQARETAAAEPVAP